ncbi:MerR family transcriptional regulator [Streptomonospora sp. PA3]|uniref:MerR family transcriptional regulator n=1 Tax=Streptomonospora sp. PA3 TaxID=2607326 RepID=UPI0012DF6BA5|nr:MerR family transcriptional regulator [Streptomonospora sp. PA3]MUL42437.1 MerR family transcriptional regulator [Streptomonospora sp. PA3]
MTIGELAERFGLATHVLRHWESMAVLAPLRTPNGQRRYTEDDLTRVATILRCKEAGLGLDQIRALLNAPDRSSRTALMRDRIAELEASIAQAQAAKHLLECALECTADDIVTCPHFQKLMAERIPPAV